MDNPYTAPQNQATVICPDCGETINKKAEICPKCGVRQHHRSDHPANKITLLLLTFFLGGIGIHRFYIGSYLLGTIYMLFFWTGIPGLIALIEFIVFIFMSGDKIEEKYEAKGRVAGVMTIIFFVSIFVLGILAAVSIPAYTDYLQRTKVAEAITLLDGLKTPAEEYINSYSRFPSSVEELGGKNQGQYTQAITSYPDSLYFEAVMNQDESAIGGKTVRLTYDAVSRIWKCSAEGANALDSIYLPSTCK
ncbi:NINE protein [Candidatus Albibeggiatoa sp. nov. BB20]|uniref:NINE protein n=1 Tax=Candidatus Albibeggiatoa sp. nov. BB20 TaxID=3162723 RepID=UPI0033655839